MTTILETVNVLTAEWMPKDQILLAPRREDNESDEDYAARCVLITNAAYRGEK